MTTTSRTMTAIALAVGSAVLSACGAAGSAETPTQGSPAGADRLARQAQEYLGDPWERRYRDRFLARQHVHDSWNPCHLGEKVLKPLQDQGPHCYDRLRSHTGRQGPPGRYLSHWAGVRSTSPGASTLTHQELADISAKSNDAVAGLGVPHTCDTSYVAGDKLYCVHEINEAGTVLEHAGCGGFPADLVAEVVEQLSPDFR